MFFSNDIGWSSIYLFKNFKNAIIFAAYRIVHSQSEFYEAIKNKNLIFKSVLGHGGLYGLSLLDSLESKPNVSFWRQTRAGFSNDLRETLTYGELLKHEIYLILRNFGWESYYNNFINCLYYRARCILIRNFLKVGKICVSKVHRKIKSPLNHSRIRLQLLN